MDPSKPISLAERSKNKETEEITAQKRKHRETSSYDGPVVVSEELRAGFPVPPKLPVEINIPISPSDAEMDTWVRSCQNTSEILQDAGLDYEEITIQLTRGKEDASPHPTIFISVLNTDDKPLWKPTLMTIGKMLHETNALDLFVLLTTKEGNADPTCHAYIIAPDHPIVRLWPDKIAKPVLEVLKSVDFNEVCVWNWGVTEELAKPTVVIVVEDKDDHHWNDLIKDVSSLCAHHGASYLEVVVIEGRQW